MARRTKIIATIGPASEDERTLKGLLQAGMDIDRINLSHESLELAPLEADFALDRDPWSFL